MSLRSTIHFILLGALFIAECLAWKQFNANSTAALNTENTALLMHLGIAAAASILGGTWLRRARFSSRVTLAFFFFIIAAVLPLAGVLVVAAIAWIFASEAGDGLRPEDKYTFGNPLAIAARRESRAKKPELRSLAEAMRSFDNKELESMIHGLRYLQPPRQTLHFLRRFQIDPQSNLQFASQGVITANYERLESQLKTITARIEDQPANIEHRLAAAEILLELAAWTPQGDATAAVYLRDAMRHVDVVLKSDPNESRATTLRAKALLSLEEPRLALRANVTSDPARLVNLQAEFLSDNFSELPKLAAALEQVPAEFAGPIAFWTGSSEPPASLRAKSA